MSVEQVENSFTRLYIYNYRTIILLNEFFNSKDNKIKCVFLMVRYGKILSGKKY